MRFSSKPVHQCYTCRLNLGSQCWEFDHPRSEWSGRKCPGFESKELYRQYRAWLEAPHVKTRKQLRQEAFRQHKAELHAESRTGRCSKSR